MLILSIETSCDETAAAVLLDGRETLSSVVSSQVEIHAEYGGVVPEIASRRHLEMISPVIAEALEKGGVRFSDIQGIVATRGPGLSGALLVGIQAAKSISFARKIPFAGVHHIEGHIFASFLEKRIEFPFLALVVSGGHTHLYHVEGFGRYRTLGRTIDDAVGEAFDKSAKAIGIEYPGGAKIDALAKGGNPEAIPFPRPMLNDGTLNFSFSGLKTAFSQQIRKSGHVLSGERISDLCASFQAAVCDLLEAKTLSALETTGARRFVVAGGVACNSALRDRMKKMSQRYGAELSIPSPSLCGDNAAMLAVAGDYYLENNFFSPLTIDVIPNWELDSVKEIFS